MNEEQKRQELFKELQRQHIELLKSLGENPSPRIVRPQVNRSEPKKFDVLKYYAMQNVFPPY